LVLLKQDIPFSQFLALMSVAEVFMITSLREGMNLSGHDFVRCQDGYSSIPQKHGSLILSEFTGSASVFSGHELLVNPWDYQQCAEAIKRALVMSAEQKQKNWELLAAHVDRHTASSWCDAYLKALAETHNVRSLKDPATVSSLSIESLKDKYANSHRRLLILEDQATLRMPGSPDESLDDRQLDTIKSLQADPNNAVYITSSRTSQQLEPLLKDLPAVGLIAENGCFVREPNNTEWHALLDESGTRDWRRGVRRVMRYFQERTEGTSIEERRSSLTFWYKEAVDRDLALRQASELAYQINGSRGDEPIRAVLNNVSVTVEPTNVTKASATDMVLQRLCGRDNAPNFLFAVGASREDESVFRWANDLSQRREVRDVFTITVGRHATAAASFLENDMAVADVLALLNQSAL
jgi:trehalose 6-phosphate synthase/phosphatase